MKAALSRPTGPRSEVSFLLPAAMLLLVVLSSYTLFSYRTTLDLLIEERRGEAETIARRLAVVLSQEGWTTSENLRQRVPNVRRVGILDGNGWPVLGGPDFEVGEEDGLAGEAPFQIGGRNYRMRVELPATALLTRQRSLEVLTPWVLILDAAILGLVFLSMRRLLVPIDRMLEKARELTLSKAAPPNESNEVSFLELTFERAVGEIADLTEAYRKSREQRLAESLTQLGEITAGVAHEMRNSIATIKGYLSLIDRDPGGQMLEESLGEIRRESDHLHRVLEDFLSFARPGSIRLAQVDLRQTLVRALEDPALGHQPYRLQVEGDETWEVAGDAQLLERALRNLVSNAASAQERAGRAGARLEVKLRKAGEKGEMLEIELRDQGTGIPAELMARLFVPFAAGHPKGVGLGLALTRRILLLHGGEIAMETREGEGTVARILLPAARGNGETVTEGNRDSG